MVEERKGKAEEQHKPRDFQEIQTMAQGGLNLLDTSMGLLTGDTLGNEAQRKLEQTQDLRMELSGKAY